MRVDFTSFVMNSPGSPNVPPSAKVRPGELPNVPPEGLLSFVIVRVDFVSGVIFMVAIFYS